MKLKAFYGVYKGLPWVSILIQMHPVHTCTPYFPNIHSNIILPSTLRSLKWSLPFRFSNQNFVCISHLFHACCINPIISDEDYKLWSFSLHNFLQSLLLLPSYIQVFSLAPCYQTPKTYVLPLMWEIKLHTLAHTINWRICHFISS